MKETLAIIKRFEPKKSGFFAHPDQYRFTLALVEIRKDIPYCREKGREGWFPFKDNFNPKYLGEYPAVIVFIGEKDSVDNYLSQSQILLDVAQTYE